MKKGNVFNIERHSLHDGPGIRTIVFLAGCPLRCLWCANPEGLQKKSLFVMKNLCVGCGTCEKVCECNAISMVDGKCTTDRLKCEVCGRCTEYCPAGARKMYGKEMTIDEVHDIVIRDEVFFRQSGGGLTISGGEPFVQWEFAGELLKRARECGINTAVETCGCVPWEHIEPFVQYINMFLYDVKHADPEKHRLFTGKTNHLIQSNLCKLGALGANITIRVPVIPGVNDTEEEIRDIAKIASEVNAVRMDVLPYHRLAESKHEQLDTIFEMNEVDILESERVDELVSSAKQYFEKINIEV